MMRVVDFEETAVDPKQLPATPSRRRWFAAAGALGALAAVASVAPRVQTPAAAEQGNATKPLRGGGYRPSAHVERYYDTARV